MLTFYIKVHSTFLNAKKCRMISELMNIHAVKVKKTIKNGRNSCFLLDLSIVNELSN